jgi:hypothetical protein
MKLLATFVAFVLLSPSVFAQTPTRKPAGDALKTSATVSARTLPIRRIVLYSNGVAYVERRGMVSGQAEVNLSFKQSQVDDVLKSMLVLDLGRGRIGAVSYNSSAPASARLADIPFSIEAGTDGEANGGLAAVLGQLQGARVTVTAASRTATGAILTVHERTSQIDENKPPVVTEQLVISTDGGELVSFDLAEVRVLRLLDEGARYNLKEFTEASASSRRRDAKTIAITSDGEGSREMVVSYTIAAPIWKTTYRVVIDSGDKPFFQGWAIVDNVGDEDWTEVALSLVSGTPVSFIQPIQQPLYRYRPVIPIPEDLQLTPQVYDPTVSEVGGPGLGTGASPGGTAGGVGTGSGGGMGPGSGRGDAPAPMPLGPVTTISDAITSEESVKTAATGKEIGDLFEYRIDQPVTVRRDRSALIPILQTRMEGERVSIYNESARADRPMSGLRLKNTSALTLEGGSLTVVDGDAYAGEALVERLKPGEQRFISFALDLGTLVRASSKTGREPAFLIRAVNGSLQAHYHETDKKIYTITNQTDRARTVYVEHPVRDRWLLSDDTPKPDEKTASVYRFRVEVKPFTTAELPVIELRALMDSYALSSLTTGEVELFVSRRYIDETMRAALDRIVEIKSKIATLDARRAAVANESAEIAADQARLRENIKALKDTAETKQLVARYVAKAGEQETRLEQIEAERRQVASERAALQTELNTAIRALAFDRRLKA